MNSSGNVFGVKELGGGLNNDGFNDYNSNDEIFGVQAMPHASA